MTKVLKDNGMIIVTPSPELMAGLKEVGASMLEDWKKAAGSDGQIMLKAYQGK